LYKNFQNNFKIFYCIYFSILNTTGKRPENAIATLTQSEKARESSIAVRATKQNAGASGGGGGEAGRGGALRGEEDKEGGHSKRHQSHRRSFALGLGGRSPGQDHNFSPP
jgi:hypothetical protein